MADASSGWPAWVSLPATVRAAPTDACNVRATVAGSPVGSAVASRGEQLQPVLDDLFRWGLPLMTEQKPEDAVRSHWLAGALGAMLTDGRPDALPVTVELCTGDQPIVIETRDGTIHIRLGRAESPSAALTGPPRPIMGLLLGPADAKANGVEYQGDPTILDRITTR